MNWAEITDDISTACKDTFGGQVLYTPKVGVEFPLTAIFEASHVVIEGGEAGIETVKPVLFIQNSDFEPLNRPAPARDDQVKIVDKNGDGKKYKVVELQPDGEAETILILMRMV